MSRIDPEASVRQRGLVRWSDPAEPRLSLVALPWAGGGAAPFRSWVPHLPLDVALWAARFPGRESRLVEPPIDDMAALVGDLAGDIASTIDPPFALFGHCSGALVAFELARELRRRQAPQPARLILASQVPPSRPTPEHEREPQVTHEALRALGLMSAEILDQEELFELFRPAIEADARLVARYDYRPEPPLEAALTVLVGAEDVHVSRDDAANWASETSGSFRVRSLEGDHLFVGAAWDRLGAAVGAELA